MSAWIGLEMRITTDKEGQFATEPYGSTRGSLTLIGLNEVDDRVVSPNEVEVFGGERGRVPEKKGRK